MTDALPMPLTKDQVESFGPADYARWVLDVIEAHPDWHDQGDFSRRTSASSCGTVMCVAGWVNYARCGYGPDIDAAADALGLDGPDYDVAEYYYRPSELAALFYHASNGQAVEALRNIAAGRPSNAVAIVRGASHG